MCGILIVFGIRAYRGLSRQQQHAWLFAEARRGVLTTTVVVRLVRGFTDLALHRPRFTKTAARITKRYIVDVATLYTPPICDICIADSRTRTWRCKRRWLGACRGLRRPQHELLVASGVCGVLPAPWLTAVCGSFSVWIERMPGPAKATARAAGRFGRRGPRRQGCYIGLIAGRRRHVRSALPGPWTATLCRVITGLVRRVPMPTTAAA